MRILLLIVFGSLGTLARYGLQGFVQEHTGAGFPTGTLIVNLSGCFVMGGITQYALAHISFPPDWRVGLTVGFLGAFTTFSTFCLETSRLMEDGEWTRTALYLLTSVVGGILAVVLGMGVGERI